MKMPKFSTDSRRLSRAGVPNDRDENVKERSIEDIHEILEYNSDEAIREMLRLEKELDLENQRNHHKNNAKNPKNKVVIEKVNMEEHIYIPEHSYIKHIKEKAHECGIEDHILITEDLEALSIAEPVASHPIKYKITIKNLIIKVGMSSVFPSLNFDKPKEKISNLRFVNKDGILFVFEGNSFVSSSPDTVNSNLAWSAGRNRYLILRNNEFKSVGIWIRAKEMPIVILMYNYFKGESPFHPSSADVTIRGGNVKVILEGNYFDSMPLNISGASYGLGGHQMVDDFWAFCPDKILLARRMEKNIDHSEDIKVHQYIKDIEDKIEKEGSKVNIKDILRMLLYMNKKITINPDDLSHWGKSITQLKDNSFFKLKIASDKCYFRGKNTINNLEIGKTIQYLYWGPYQNIDPKGEHAHDHKQMFIELIERATQNNDKMLETKLRRELLKCERVLICKEKTWRSLQDRIIFGWSSFVSDYGTSWARPLLGLFIINTLLAVTVIVCFFDPKYSWWFMSTEFKPEFSWYLFLADWSILFFQSLNPLSNLADVTGIKNNGWISFFHILQKAFLALFLYEIIKIFRRFSK